MIILDSSVLIAALSAKDSKHRQALALLAEVHRGFWGRALIPECVFVEVTNFLQRKFGRREALRFVQALRLTNEARVVAGSPLFDRALELFLRDEKSALGFADLSIVALADEEGVRNLATFDEGLRAYPRLNVIRSARSPA